MKDTYIIFFSYHFFSRIPNFFSGASIKMLTLKKLRWIAKSRNIRDDKNMSKSQLTNLLITPIKEFIGKFYPYVTYLLKIKVHFIKI